MPTRTTVKPTGTPWRFLNSAAAAATRARTDAANFGQLTDGVTDLRNYVDGEFNLVYGRLAEQDEKIDQIGAMGAAMSTMLASASGIQSDNRIAAGVGFMGGESSLAIGYQRKINDRATFTLGGAFTNDESSAGLGFGYGW